MTPFGAEGHLGCSAYIQHPRDLQLWFLMSVLPPGPIPQQGKARVTRGQTSSQQVLFLSICPRLNLKWTRRAESFGWLGTALNLAKLKLAGGRPGPSQIQSQVD